MTGGRLSQWQIKFLVDINGRIDRYGHNVRLSDKQLAKLNEIISAPAQRQHYQRPANVVLYARPQSRNSYRPQRRSGYRPYRRSWFGRRIGYQLMAFAVVAVVALVASLIDKDMPSFSGSGLMTAPTSTQRFTQSNIALNDFSITDGDTIRVNGERKGTRLVGFNTPETIEPGCAEERALGQKAKARLRQLLSKGRLSLERVGCACKPGTEGTNACNYGRSCGILRVDGRNVGDILISEGLAEPFICGATSCPPTPRPWCS
ncbi:MAG: thermonuclease family protein [Rhizobiaceae bacterium]|nr:thermonuclease family protein [Rhizobiaceae bacterium]